MESRRESSLRSTWMRNTSFGNTFQGMTDRTANFSPKQISAMIINEDQMRMTTQIEIMNRTLGAQVGSFKAQLQAANEEEAEAKAEEERMKMMLKEHDKAAASINAKLSKGLPKQNSFRGIKGYLNKGLPQWNSSRGVLAQQSTTPAQFRLRSRGRLSNSPSHSRHRESPLSVRGDSSKSNRRQGLPVIDLKSKYILQRDTTNIRSRNKGPKHQNPTTVNSLFALTLSKLDSRETVTTDTIKQIMKTKEPQIQPEIAFGKKVNLKVKQNIRVRKAEKVVIQDRRTKIDHFIENRNRYNCTDQVMKARPQLQIIENSFTNMFSPDQVTTTKSPAPKRQNHFIRPIKMNINDDVSEFVKSSTVSPTFSYRKSGMSNQNYVGAPLPQLKHQNFQRQNPIQQKKIDHSTLQQQNNILDDNRTYVANFQNVKEIDMHNKFTSMYSTFNKVPTGIQKFQKFGRFPEKSYPTTVEQRKFLQEISIEKEDFPRLYDDPRLLSLLKIRLQNKEMKEDELMKQKKEFEKIVKFLLSQVHNPDQALVDEIANRLISKVYSTSFNEFATDDQALATDFAVEVRQKKAFYDMCKEAQRPQVKENNKDNYLFKYYEECTKAKVFALPIFGKVKDQRLDLRGKFMNDGVCTAFTEAVKLHPDILTSILLEDNQFTDARLSTVMEGVCSLTTIKQIIIKHNEVLNSTIQHLRSLFKRPFPNNLEDLRLISVKTTPFMITELMNGLIESCQLKKLTLIKCQFSDLHIPQIIQILDKARFLIELDLSWSQITCPFMFQLTECLAENRTLRAVNLSWNFLTSQTKGKMYDFDQHSQEDADLEKQYGNKVATIAPVQPVIQPQISPRDGESRLDNASSLNQMILTQEQKDIIEEKQRMEYFESRKRKPRLEMTLEEYGKILGIENSISKNGTHDMMIICNLERFIKRNKQLIHLDLTQTNLTEFMLWKLGSSLSRTKSLVSIHFSGNQGITPALKQHLFKRIKCKIIPQTQKIGLDLGMDYGGFGLKESPQKLTMQMNQEKFFRQNMLLRANKQKQIRPSKTSEQNKLVFERQLGHKVDIPGSGQWRQLTLDEQKCWVCDQHTYTLVFWSRKTGLQSEDEVTCAQEENLIDQIENHNNRFKNYQFPLNPVYFGQMTSWKPQEMINITDFCYNIDKEAPDAFAYLKSMDKLPEDLEKKEDMDSEQKAIYNEYIRLHKRSSYQTSDDVKKLILRDLRYKSMHFVNPELMLNLDKYFKEGLEEDMNQVYVFAGFMKPGRHCLAVAYPDREEDFLEPDLKYYTHKIVIPSREDDVTPFIKDTKMRTVVRTFQQEKSVFANWIVDRDQTPLQCIENDLVHWNADKFVKDPADLAELCDVVRKYAEPLKNIFIQIASRSHFPQITSLDFRAFCQRASIIDDYKGATQSAIDTCFIAANNNSFKVELMSKELLMRYKFLEIITRIAKAKFVDSSQLSTVDEALDKLIKDVILVNYVQDPWMEFRTEKLWTIEVNDVLVENMEGLQLVQRLYHTDKKKYMTKKDAIKLVTKDSNVAISDRDAIYCYGMSKMTVEHEVKESKKYDRLELVEFAEMVGRIADIKYKDQLVFDLGEKIELILDDLFALLPDYKRNEKAKFDEEQSDSDNDY